GDASLARNEQEGIGAAVLEPGPRGKCARAFLMAEEFPIDLRAGGGDLVFFHQVREGFARRLVSQGCGYRLQRVLAFREVGNVIAANAAEAGRLMHEVPMFPVLLEFCPGAIGLALGWWKLGFVAAGPGGGLTVAGAEDYGQEPPAKGHGEDAGSGEEQLVEVQ